MFAVGKWNSCLEALIFLNDDKLFPLQVVLKQILIFNENVLQQYFIKGVLIGSLKG